MSLNIAMLPGMEGLSRFEDEGDTNINVVVNDPEAAVQAVEEQAEAVEATSEVEEAVAETEGDEAAAEQIEQLYARLDAHKAYLEKYGYTKEFALLANYDGMYDKMCAHHKFPAVESLSNVASPSDVNAIAALEGIGEAANAVWMWIKNACKKVLGWVKKIGGAIANLFRTQIGKIHHLQEVYKNLKGTRKDADKIKDVKIFGAKDIASIKDPMDKMDKFDIDTKSLSGALDVLSEHLRTGNPQAKLMTMTDAYTDNRSKDERKKADDDFKENVKKIKEKIKSPETALKDADINEGSALLDAAVKGCQEYNKRKDLVKIFEKFAKQIDDMATKFAKIADVKAEAKREGRNVMTWVISDQSKFNTLLGVGNQIVNACIKSAAAIAGTYE